MALDPGATTTFILSGLLPPGTPEVRVFSTGPGRVNMVASWLAYEPSFSGGVRVSGTVLAPGAPFTILTAPGPGRPIDVGAWAIAGDGASLVAALRADSTASSGASAAVADLDGDGALDLVVGASEGAPAIVRLFSKATGAVRGESTLYPPTFLGGVRFSLGLLDGGPGRPEFIAAPGAGGLPRIETYFLVPGGAAKRLDFLALERP